MVDITSAGFRRLHPFYKACARRLRSSAYSARNKQPGSLLDMRWSSVLRDERVVKDRLRALRRNQIADTVGPACFKPLAALCWTSTCPIIHACVLWYRSVHAERIEEMRGRFKNSPTVFLRQLSRGEEWTSFAILPAYSRHDYRGILGVPVKTAIGFTAGPMPSCLHTRRS